MGNNLKEKYLYLFINDSAIFIRDEDPILAKNRIQGSVPQTKGDFYKSTELIC